MKIKQIEDMGTMRYKPSDKVRIKSIDWYNENKDEDGDVPCNCNILFLAENKKYLGTTQTVERVYICEGQYVGNYIYELKGIENTDWTDEMIEGLVEEETKTLTTEKMDKVIEEAKTYWDSIKDAWICPEGYQFVDENGNIINAQKIILEKKKPKYPKNYEECCKILGLNDLINMHLSFMDKDAKITASTNYHIKTLIELNCLTKLLICRDAYWKLYGEEMGLGKPWKPIWSIYEHKFCLGTDKDKVIEECVTTGNRILAFPTKEMRDAFYENFKSEIESCKEFL